MSRRIRSTPSRVPSHGGTLRRSAPTMPPDASTDRWFRNLLESAPDAMVIVDQDGCIVLVNGQLEKLFGYARDDLVGQRVEMLVPERYRGVHPERRRNYFSDPRARPMGAGLDLHALRKDGTEFPAEISLSPMQTPEGVLVTAAIRDVTDRKKVEAKFRALLEAAPDAMVIVERSGHIVLVNSQAERLFGYARKELLGQPVELLVPERFRGAHPAHRSEYFGEPRMRAMGSGLDLHGRRRDGSEFPVEISLSPLETEEGTLITSAIRDVSERHALQRERAARAEAEKLAHENARLYADAQMARANAEAANRAKDEFLSVLSHELRTPLTPILAWTRLLRGGRVGPDGMVRALEAIERNTKTQARLIEDLLDISRIVSGKLQLERRPLELPDVVQAAVDSVRPALDAKGLVLELRIDPAAGPVLGDALRLQQVVWNLLSNAIKFTPVGGRIVVSLVRAGSEAELSVSDTGQGIGGEFMPHLFERFRQADSSSKRAHGGLGIGLAIVRNLTELHRGTVEAASEGEGKGARFTVRLPIAPGSKSPSPARRTSGGFASSSWTTIPTPPTCSTCWSRARAPRRRRRRRPRRRSRSSDDGPQTSCCPTSGCRAATATRSSGRYAGASATRAGRDSARWPSPRTPVTRTASACSSPASMRTSTSPSSPTS
jgi:PAS domain S-box-containing protein